MQGEVLQRLSDRAANEHLPFEVLLEITHRCNLPCKHCYLPDHEDHGELTFAEICDLLDQLAAAGTLFLTLTGGEVFSRSDFLDILDAAVARGFTVKVMTNATMITDESAAHLYDAGVIEVSVSIYGATAEVHDVVTDMPGSFQRTLDGIERMKKAGLYVIVKAPLLTDNGKTARDILTMSRMMNMPCSFDVTITPKNDGNLSPLALQLQKPALVELMTHGSLAEVLAPSGFDGHPGPEPCNAGRSYCGISPIGDVVPCLMMPVKAGNIREQSFAQIWHGGGGGILDEVRGVTFESLTTCRSCDVKSVCTRCPGQAMLRGQGIDGCDIAGKEVAKARMAAHRLRVIQ
jgi:radical SAM protein with 4Fe4S-binding SPASM domain